MDPRAVADVDRLRLGALVRLLQAEGSSTARDRGVRGLEVEHVGSCRISLRLDLQPAGESRRRKGARGQDQVRRRVEAVLGGAELEAFEPGLHPALEEPHPFVGPGATSVEWRDRKSTRLNSSHVKISYAVFCLKKKKKNN